MQFDSIAEVIHMGGYGAFVWSSYLLGLAVVVFNTLAPFMMRRKFFRNQAARQAREDV